MCFQQPEIPVQKNENLTTTFKVVDANAWMSDGPTIRCDWQIQLEREFRSDTRVVQLFSSLGPRIFLPLGPNPITPPPGTNLENCA